MNDLFTQNNPIALRDYQVKGLKLLDAEIAKGSVSPLFVAPTGSGKTTWAAELMRREIERGGKALFLAPRRELIRQASQRLREAGILHGVILAGEGHLEYPDMPAQIGSIDTLISRLFRNRRPMDLPDFSLVIVDEAHLAVTERRKELLAVWPNAQIIGLTATPIRKDGRALGMMFDSMIEATSVAELTNSGYLVKARYFSLSEPDLRRVRTTAGDWNAKDLESAVNNAKLVGDIVAHWLEHAATRRTVVFCTSIAHSMAVTDAFMQAGVAAEHVDAGTPTAEREATFQRFTSGRTQVLTNCFLASYGFDLPALSCVVLARPTKSLMLFLQMIGRGLRPAEGKADCLVLDHSGCVHMHGFAHDSRDWTLDGIHQFSTKEARDKEASEGKPIDCPECHAVFARTLVCPECGYRLKPAAKDVPTADGKLIELGGDGTQPMGDPIFYRELLWFQNERAYKPGWAAHKFKAKFGRFPPFDWNRMEPKVTTVEVARWIKSQQIAWVKAQKKTQEQART